jgi:hypothetical protein
MKVSSCGVVVTQIPYTKNQSSDQMSNKLSKILYEFAAVFVNLILNPALPVMEGLVPTADRGMAKARFQIRT